LLLAIGSPRLPLIACAILSVAGTVLYTMGLRHVPGERKAVSPVPSPLRQAGLRIVLVCAACYGVAADPRGDGVLVAAQAGDEGPQRRIAAGGHVGHPLLEVVAAAFGHEPGERADVRGALGGTAGEGTAGRDAVQYLEPPDMRYQFY
jgi:hypothetical protein